MISAFPLADARIRALPAAMLPATQPRAVHIDGAEYARPGTWRFAALLEPVLLAMTGGVVSLVLADIAAGAFMR
jgi:hypothetical protein